MFGGAFYCFNCYTLKFTTPTYSNNSAYKGGSIYLEYDKGVVSQKSVVLDMSKFNIRNSKTASDGGFLYFDGENTTTLNFTIT